MIRRRSFAPPEGWPAGPHDIDSMIDAARGDLTADQSESEGGVLVLRDTADGRLAAAGWQLVCSQEPGDRECWRLMDTDGDVHEMELLHRPVPSFTDGLPDGRLAKRLDDLCHARALRPMLDLDQRETRVALRDGEGKIRCRVTVETVLERSDPAVAATTVSISALKGYGADANSVAGRLATRLGWPPAKQDPIGVLRHRHGDPGAAGTPRSRDALPTDPAGPVLRDVLAHQLDVILDRLPGVVDDVDPTYLHQMRVAIRRTRSALSQLSPALAAEGRDAAIDGFRWLGQITGPVRDLDVQLIDLGERRRQLSQNGGDRDSLAVLARHLRAEKTKAQKALVRALTGPRFAAIAEDWRRALDPSVESWTSTEVSRAPFAEVVANRAAKLHRRVIRDGRQITPETPAEALHDLRKRMKKLRYVIEFLGDVHPRARMRPLIRALKGLQDVLGRVQDREVQVEALRRYGHALAAKAGGNADALMAIGAWSEELERDRVRARDEFAAAFRVFTSKETRALFRAIFAPPTTPSAVPPDPQEPA